jgi:hypothetical protein
MQWQTRRRGCVVRTDDLAQQIEIDSGRDSSLL